MGPAGGCAQPDPDPATTDGAAPATSSRAAASRRIRRCPASASWPASSASIRIQSRAVIEDLKRSGYVEARGEGMFVAPAPPARPSPHLREGFLQDTVIRAAALGMTADDLSWRAELGRDPARRRPGAPLKSSLVECSRRSSDFFARQLEAHSRSASTRYSWASWRRSRGAGSKAGRCGRRSRASAISRRWSSFSGARGSGDRAARRGASRDLHRLAAPSGRGWAWPPPPSRRLTT